MSLTTRPQQAEVSNAGTSRRLITAKELAAHLATTPRNINRQAAQGKIPHVRFGSSVRFDPKVVATALGLENPIA